MISVCIATYNGGKYIQEQLESILVQLNPEDEVIVSDDNSIDNTLDIIENIHDQRVNVFVNKSPKGYTSNFENALKKSKGDVIFLADQDDVWMENKVMIAMKQLEENDIVIHDASVVNDDLEIIHQSNFNLRNVKHGLIHNLIRCRYLGACYAFNRKLLNKSLPFPKNHNLIPHDYWLYMIGGVFFKTGISNHQLIKYRRHDLNASDGGNKSSNSMIKKIIIRFYLISNLLGKIFR